MRTITAEESAQFEKLKIRAVALEAEKASLQAENRRLKLKIPTNVAVKGVKFRIAKVPPAQAAEYLNNLWPGQRKRSKAHVDNMAMDMRNGNWRLSPDALVFVKGMMVNGQHRMASEVQSNTTQTFLILETDDEELYKFIDNIKKRTLADRVAALTYGKQVSSMIPWILNYEGGNNSAAPNSRGAPPVKLLSTHGYRFTSPIEAVEYIEDNSQDLVEAAARVMHLYPKSLALNVSISGAIYVLGMHNGLKHEVDKFFEQLYDTQLSGQNVVGDLRKKLLLNRTRSKNKKYLAGFIYALTLKAFALYVQGKRPAVLTINPGEQFPVLSQLKKK